MNFKFKSNRLIKCYFFGGLLIAFQSFAQGQGYPNKPIVIKVAFPTGGPADASIRSSIVVLQKNLGQNLIAENIPGANGSIGAMNVLNSTPDGYTLLGTTGSDFLTAPIIISSAKYDPEKFKLLGVVGISDFVLISSPKFSFKNIDEVIEFLKKPGNPGLSIAHWGSGSSPHLVGADLQSIAGVKFLEIPYKGAAPAIVDVAGGQVDLTFAPLGGSTLGMIQSGKVKAIALASDKRNPALPDVPTINESKQIKNFEYSVWSAIFAPPKTPDTIVERLTMALNDWVISPENQARISANASRRLDPMSTSQAAVFLKNQNEKYSRITKSLNITQQ